LTLPAYTAISHASAQTKTPEHLSAEALCEGGTQTNQKQPNKTQNNPQTKPSENKKTPQNNRRKEKPHENQSKEILLSIHPH
jgi:hypothetical protein